MAEFDTVIRNGVVVTAAFLHHLLLATTIASALVVVESWPSSRRWTTDLEDVPDEALRHRAAARDHRLGDLAPGELITV